MAQEVQAKRNFKNIVFPAIPSNYASAQNMTFSPARLSLTLGKTVRNRFTSVHVNYVLVGAVLLHRIASQEKQLSAEVQCSTLPYVLARTFLEFTC